jgi:Fur family transcriptional regulator, iron response regulator
LKGRAFAASFPISEVNRLAELRTFPPRGAQAGEAMNACPVHLLRGKLRRASLRPTRQRIALGWLLFGKGDRHVTAETLYEEAVAMKVPVSLATVYNTLHQFTQAGLLNEIAVDGSRTYFDTNITPHHHFLIEETNSLLDIPKGEVAVSGLPQAPEGTEIARVDVIVRIKRTAAAAAR